MHDAVAVAVRVPEEQTGFAVSGAGYCLVLEDVRLVAGHVVVDGYCGGLVQSHQPGKFGKDRAD